MYLLPGVIKQYGDWGHPKTNEILLVIQLFPIVFLGERSRDANINYILPLISKCLREGVRKTSFFRTNSHKEFFNPTKSANTLEF